MQRLKFFSDCVHWPEDQVEDLNAMIREGKEITRTTFLKSVDPEEMKRLEQQLGYERDPRKGLTMAKDWHVGYYRSTVRGCPAVYFVWSAIEHVFTDLECLRKKPATEEAPEEEASRKTFMVIDQFTKETVFQDIQEDHPFFRSIERVLDGPSHHSKLAMDERMLVQARASGTKGTYSIWRTS